MVNYYEKAPNHILVVGVALQVRDCSTGTFFPALCFLLSA